ncbi:1301_t:CDS:2 [Entrophospora sp. SA101]|nr:1301_t:CDS:2 [Entrophospora sp. SA101]
MEKEISLLPLTSNYFSSSDSAEIILHEEKIGLIGRVQSPITNKYQIKEPVFIAQISLTKIFNFLAKFPRPNTYRPISPFPISKKDLSFLFSEKIDYNQVVKEIAKLGGNNLQEVTILDVYQNKELEQENKKSVSFHLVFQSSTKTLEKKEVEEILKIINKPKEQIIEELKGIKRTTGQHPGGLLITLPETDIQDYTPLHYPADNRQAE